MLNQWASIPLGKVTTKIGSGATPTGGKNSYKKEGISLVRSLNVYDFSFEYPDLARIDPKQAKKLDGVTVQRNDVLINITGASVGRCCIVPSNVLPARVNQHVSILRSNPEVLDAKYLLYCINSPKIKSSLLALAQGGATREALTKDTLENFEIPVPPLHVQKKIASILSAYDSLIENNLQRIRILEEMAQRLYREWFISFRFPGHKNIKTVETEHGLIPEGWNIIKLEDLMDFQGGSQPPKSEWLQAFEPGCIRMIQIRDYESDNYIEYVKQSSSLKLCSRKDIMIARYGASVGRICWGLSGAYNVALVKVLPKEAIYREFLRAFLSNEYFQAMLIGMSGRTAQAGFNKTVLQSIPLVFPQTNHLLNMFENNVNLIRDKQLVLKDTIYNLRQTRDILLSRLISGEQDVANLNINIPEESE